MSFETGGACQRFSASGGSGTHETHAPGVYMLTTQLVSNDGEGKDHADSHNATTSFWGPQPATVTSLQDVK